MNSTKPQTSPGQLQSSRSCRASTARIWLFIVCLLIVGFTGFILGALSRECPVATNDYLAKCLAEKATLYVREGCPYCANQKAMFGSSVKYLRMIDCEYEQQKCIDAGIEAVPTWEVCNATVCNKYIGVKEIEELTEITGCQLI